MGYGAIDWACLLHLRIEELELDLIFLRGLRVSLSFGGSSPNFPPVMFPVELVLFTAFVRGVVYIERSSTVVSPDETKSRPMASLNIKYKKNRMISMPKCLRLFAKKKTPRCKNSILLYPLKPRR